MNIALIAKELRENKWVILVAAIALGVLTPVYPYSYSSLLTYWLGEGITYDRFLWYDWFLKAQPQVMIIAAIIMGSTAIAREKKNATLGVLVIKPVSRATLLMNKLIAGSAALIIMLAADTFMLTLTSPIMGAQGMDISYMLLGLLGDLLLVLPVYLMAAAFSIFFMNSIKAGLITTGIILILYGPAWFGYNITAIWWLLGKPGEINPAAAIALAAAGAIFAGLGIMRFNKIEV